MPDTLIHFGGAIKALDDTGKVGGYLVRFTDADRKDLVGDYFTAKTYLGAHNGDGVDTLFHHGLAIKDGFDKYADHLFTPLKAKKDEIGIWAETILDMADEYEKTVFELVKSGKLGWSSGATGHMVKRAEDGELLRWPIAEGSLTPTPCEPMNRAMSLKAYIAKQSQSTVKAMFEDMLKERTEDLYNLCDVLMGSIYRTQDQAWMARQSGNKIDVTKTIEECLAEFGARVIASVKESLTTGDIKSLAGSTFAGKLSHALAAVEGVTKQAREIHELRKGESRKVTLNEDRRASLTAIKCGIDDLLTECTPLSEEAFQLEAEFLRTQARMLGVS